MSTTVLRTIKLSGPLARQFGHVHHMAVESAGEAARALCMMIPGFEKFLMESKDRGMDFAVHVGRRNISEDELLNYAGSDDEIRFVPIMRGRKSGGIIQIIVGVVLVVVGGFITGWTFGAAAPFGSMLITMGVGLIAGGIVTLLMGAPKTPKNNDKMDNATSDIFNGPVNTQAQGNCVPVLYGDMFIGSAVVSAGITTADNYVVPTGTGYGVGGGGVRGGGGSQGDVLARFANAAL